MSLSLEELKALRTGITFAPWNSRGNLVYAKSRHGRELGIARAHQDRPGKLGAIRNAELIAAAPMLINELIRLKEKYEP